MKERDKIQIQCLKGKNPYIQTAYLENGKIIYLVKTVDDDPQGSRQNTNSVPLPALCRKFLPIVRP